MQSDELFAPKLLIQHVEQSSPHQLGAGGRFVFRVGRLAFDRVFVQGLVKEVVVDHGGVLAVISDGTGELVAQIPRAQLQGRGLPEVGQGLKVIGRLKARAADEAHAEHIVLVHKFAVLPDGRAALDAWLADVEQLQSLYQRGDEPARPAASQHDA